MKILAGLALGMTVALAGCASPDQKTDGELIAASSASATRVVTQEEQPQTGSRLARRTTTDRAPGAADQPARPASSGQ